MFTQAAGIANTLIKGGIAIYRSDHFTLAQSQTWTNVQVFQIPVFIDDIRGVCCLEHLTHLLKRINQEIHSVEAGLNPSPVYLLNSSSF